MATRYVDSAATGAANGTTWADAYTTLAAVAAVDTAGDVIYVKSTHSESTAGAVSLSWAGTQADPTRIICVSDSNEPPTTLATGAVVATTGASDLTVASSGFVYVYGVRFKAGDSTSAADVSSTASQLTLDNCALELGGNNSGSDFTFSSVSSLTCIACTFKSVNSGSRLGVGGTSRLFNCSIESGGTPGAPFFDVIGAGSDVIISGFDFTNLSASASLFAATTNNRNVTLLNCKMPGSWTGSVNSSAPLQGSFYMLVNCDSADTNYRLQYKTQFGEVTNETTLKRTGGASDGTTGIAWKMVSTADAEWSHQTLDTPEIVQWNESTGSSKTATIEILHDSATNLTDQDIWVEVMYLGTSGYPLGSMVSDAAATYLTSAADQTTSSETWTTTGMSNPNKQKLSVSFTPQEKGFIHATVKLAKASKTVYVDPVITIA